MIKDTNNIDSKLLEEDDRIAAYIKGQLSPEEEQLFLKELEDNPALKEKAIVKLQRQIEEIDRELHEIKNDDLYTLSKFNFCCNKSIMFM